MVAASVAEEVARDFYGGRLDLSARGGPSAPGWADMPEVACVRACRRDGVPERTVRRLLTLVSAMARRPRPPDPARDSAAASTGNEHIATAPPYHNAHCDRLCAAGHDLADIEGRPVLRTRRHPDGAASGRLM